MNTIRTLRQSVCLEPINLNVMMTGTGEKSGHPKKMTLAGEKSVNPNKMTGEKSGHPNKMTLAQRISKVFGDMEWSIDVCWFTYVYFVEGMFNTLWSLSTIYLTVFQDISVAQAGFVTSITFIPNALRIPIALHCYRRYNVYRYAIHSRVHRFDISPTDPTDFPGCL
eukprot:1000246_1